MLQVWLLGKYEARLKDRPIDLSSRPAQSLLAYLLLNPNQPIRREKLAGLIWPDSTETNARTNLRHALWRVRRSFDSEADAYLQADDLTISLRLQADDWVDVNVLDTPVQDDVSTDALVGIASAYGGELLPGFYEDWVEAERERLKAVFEQRMKVLLDRLVMESRWEEVIHWGERWISLGFTPEHAFRAMMLAHAGVGDLGGSASVYQRCILALERDLDIKPSAQTRELFQKLSRGRLAEVIPQSRLKKLGSKTTGSIKPKSNLPNLISSFIGRKIELKDLRHRMKNSRLVTLTGAGGSGKTRLAIRVASDLVSEYPHGVWFVDLAPLSKSEEVYPAIASVLGIRETRAIGLREALVNYLDHKNILLILDNCEHLIDACAGIAENLLLRCPDLNILATSRESLGIAGEINWMVPPLSLPPIGEIMLEELMNFDAIHLFRERMFTLRTVDEMRLEKDGWETIANICTQLDGLPLAIELAAARTKVLSLEQIAGRLQDRFRLLRGGDRTALPRHKTLQAMIDWSYHLLTEEEQAAFRRLAVFSGSWTIEAAEAVICEQEKDLDEDLRGGSNNDGSIQMSPDDVLNLLGQLVNKSLVVTEHSSVGQLRYRMLETIQEYAKNELAKSKEYNPVFTRHLDYFIQVVEIAEPELNGPQQKRWINRLEQDYENIRAAVDWAVRTGDLTPAKGLQLVGGLKHFWDIRGNLGEPRRWAQKVLRQSGNQRRSLAGAKTLQLAGWYANEQGNIEEAYSLLREALDVCLEIGQPAKARYAYVLQDLGRLAWYENEFRKGRQITLEALKIRREVDDRWGIAQSLLMLGEFAMNLGEPTEARTLWEEGLEVAKVAGDKRLIGFLLGGLGEISDKLGALDLAYAYSLQSLSIAMEINDHQLAGTYLCGLSGLMIRSGGGNHLEDAVQLWGAAEALLREYGSSRSSLSNYDEIEQRVDALRERLGEGKYEAALARGQAMDFDQAMTFALSTSHIK